MNTGWPSTIVSRCPISLDKTPVNSVRLTLVSHHLLLVGCPPSKYAIFLIHLRLYDADSLVNQGNRGWFHPLVGQYIDQLILDSYHHTVEDVMEVLLDIALTVLCTLGQ